MEERHEKFEGLTFDFLQCSLFFYKAARDTKKKRGRKNTPFMRGTYLFLDKK